MGRRKRRSVYAPPVVAGINNNNNNNNNNHKKQRATTKTTCAPSPPHNHNQKTEHTTLRIKIPNSISKSNIIITPRDNAQQQQQQTQDPPQTQHFQVHDSYRIMKLLGAGAFGKVYQATRLQSNDQVALKIVPKYLTTHEAVEREVKALRVLSSPGHDHVCRLIDYHQDEANHYLVMEHIDGGEELFEHLVRQQGPFSEKDAAKFLKQLASGLAYMHSKGYVHADLKPENLMMSCRCHTNKNHGIRDTNLDDNGNIVHHDDDDDDDDEEEDDDDDDPHVKLVDFGFSVPVSPECDDDSSARHHGQHGLVFGTIAYLAPEILQYFGTPQQPTTAADLFAVGAIMYTMLTGSHPFDRTNSASDEDIQRAVVSSLPHVARDGDADEYLNKHVFDDRTSGLSDSAVSLMKNLLQPIPNKRVTAIQLLDHPWILGETASSRVLHHTKDTKLRRFWQRRFRAAILQKYHAGILTSQEKLHVIFNSMDLNGDGHISFDELEVSFKDMFGIEQMQDLFQSMDIKENGVIDYDEFETIMKTQFETNVSTITTTTTTTTTTTADITPRGSGIADPKNPMPFTPNPVAAAVSVSATSVSSSRTSITSCDSNRNNNNNIRI